MPLLVDEGPASNQEVLEKADMLEEVLSQLELLGLVRASSVCKAWGATIAGEGSQAPWVALLRRIEGWEAEEGQQLDAWLAQERLQFPHATGDYEWVSTELLARALRAQEASGEAVPRRPPSMLELMRSPALRTWVAAVAPAATPPSPKETVMTSGLWQHAQGVVELLHQWAADIRAAEVPFPDSPAADHDCASLLGSMPGQDCAEDSVPEGPAGSSPAFEAISAETVLLRDRMDCCGDTHAQDGNEVCNSSAQSEGSTELPADSILCQQLEELAIFPDEASDGGSDGAEEEAGMGTRTPPLDAAAASPRTTMPCNFICTAAELLEEQQQRHERVAAMQAPAAPRAKRRFRRPPSARPTAAALRSVRRTLDFNGDSDGSAFAAAGDESPPLAPSTPPAAAVLTSPASLDQRWFAASWDGPMPAVNSPKKRSSQAAAQLAAFARRLSVTRFVDLLGNLNAPSGGPRQPDIHSFIQKVVVQAEVGGLEARVLQSFGWQRSSAQWTAAAAQQEQRGPPAAADADGDGEPPPSEPLPVWAEAAGGGNIMITQLEHRYTALLSVSVRRTGGRAPPQPWRELLHISQHTGRQFSPEETLRLRHEALTELRAAWGLSALTDKQAVRLLVALGGRQPLQMASILRHLFRTLDPQPSRSCAARHRRRGAAEEQLGGGPYCDSCDGGCFESRMLANLPRLLCMTDESLLEDIAWVVTLGQQA
mmetsp:Transcript_20527/g.53697  ORF Transcript_20527/g.53697 Transcript_20527/m.53697 type:complete len:712 (+) Transcript_20527:573-2708(+)